MKKLLSAAGTTAIAALLATTFSATSATANTTETTAAERTLTVTNVENTDYSKLLGTFGPAANPVTVTKDWFYESGGPGFPPRRVPGIRIHRVVDGTAKNLGSQVCGYGFGGHDQATAITDAAGDVWINHTNCRPFKVTTDNTIEYPKLGGKYFAMTGVGPQNQTPQFIATKRGADDSYELQVSQWQDGAHVVIDSAPIAEDIYSAGSVFRSYESDGAGNSSVVVELAVRVTGAAPTKATYEYRQVNGEWQTPTVLDGLNNHTSQTTVTAAAYTTTGGIAFRTDSVGVSKLKWHTAKCRYGGDLTTLGRCELPYRTPTLSAALGAANTIITATSGTEANSLTVHACDLTFKNCTSALLKDVPASDFTNLDVIGTNGTTTQLQVQAGSEPGDVTRVIDLTLTSK